MLRIVALFCFLLFSSLSAVAQEIEYPPITPENAADLRWVAEIGAPLPGGIAWSPDGEYLAVGTTDGALLYRPMESDQPVRVFESDRLARFDDDGLLETSAGRFDPETGERVGDLDPPSSTGIILLPDTSLSEDGVYRGEVTADLSTLVISEVATGTEIIRIEPETQIDVWRFSPDSQYVAITNPGGRAAIWRVADGSQVSTISTGCGIRRFTQDNTRLISGSCVLDHFYQIYDVLTGERLSYLPESSQLGWGDVFSTDDHFFATWQDGMVEVYDTNTGTKLVTLDAISDYLGRVRDFDNQNGQVVFGDRLLRCFDILTGEQSCELDDITELGHQLVRWSDDGSVLLVIGNPPDWRPDLPITPVYPHEADLAETLWIDWHPDNSYFLSPDGDAFIVVRPEPMTQVISPTQIEVMAFSDRFDHIETYEIDGRATEVIFSPDQRFTAVPVWKGDQATSLTEIRIYQGLAFDNPLLVIPIESDLPLAGIGDVQFSATSGYLSAYLLYQDGNFQRTLWKLDADMASASSPIMLPDTPRFITSHDEHYAVGMVQVVEPHVAVWELDTIDEMGGTPQPTRVIATDTFIEQFAFTPDNRILAMNTGSQITLWDFAALIDGETGPLVTLDTPDYAQFAFSPDGTLFYVVTPNRVMAYGISA